MPTFIISSGSQGNDRQEQSPADKFYLTFLPPCQAQPPQIANERLQVGDARGVKKELVQRIESLDFPRKHVEQSAFHKERQKLPNARGLC